MIYLQIAEILLRVDENGELKIPTDLLQKIGLSPGDPAYLVYLAGSGGQELRQEFWLSPSSLEQPGLEESKIMLPTSLLEQANLSPGQDIQILCLDGGIALCGESSLDKNELRYLLEQLQTASELASALPNEAGPLIQQLDQFIQKGVRDDETAE
ncbi:hypothetical protein [Flavonifractor sp. An100]|uniref:hypothetical protein n=1 Tax=Flavonifractor sp. An100 TaxID=1965538 RepID=UPI00117B29B2|nr:hypothetical protein [Flavonifractor sp. An100]